MSIKKGIKTNCSIENVKKKKNKALIKPWGKIGNNY